MRGVPADPEVPAMDTSTDDLIFDETIGEPESPPLPPAPRAVARALVVEDDPDTARICSHRLAELGMDTKVVWTEADADGALAASGADLAFVFVDLALAGGAGHRVAEEARRLHPASTIVEASGSIADVLCADGVVLCKPFTAEQFESAFDAALFEGPIVERPADFAAFPFEELQATV